MKARDMATNILPVTRKHTNSLTRTYGSISDLCFMDLAVLRPHSYQLTRDLWVNSKHTPSVKCSWISWQIAAISRVSIHYIAALNLSSFKMENLYHMLLPQMNLTPLSCFFYFLFFIVLKHFETFWNVMFLIIYNPTWNIYMIYFATAVTKL